MLTGSNKSIGMRPLKHILPKSKSKNSSKTSAAVKETPSQLVCSMPPLSQEDNKSSTTSTSVARSLNKASLPTSRFLTLPSSANPNLREERISLSSLAICSPSRENSSPKSRRDKFSHMKACQSARCSSISSEQLMCPSGSSIMKTMINTFHKRENKEKETKADFRNTMTFSKRNKLKLLSRLNLLIQRLMKKSFLRHRVQRASIQSGTKSLLILSRPRTRSLSKRLN